MSCLSLRCLRKDFMPSMCWICIMGAEPLRGTLADEDVEGDPDRWCSYAAHRQEAWQIIWQWVWNLRLALGQQLAGDVVRLIELAPATPSAQVEMTVPADEPYGEYGPL